MLTRRQLLQTGFAGAVVLGLARFAYGPITPDAVYAGGQPSRFKVLDAESCTAIAAIARVMLKGALPTNDTAAYAMALQAAVAGCDTVISGLPETVQDEVKDLLALLASRLSRRWIAGVSSAWEAASDDEVAYFLNRWRYSAFSLLRSGYQALHQIVFAAWYGNPQAWVGIGYEGPPEFVKGYWHA
ncbi:hypothetical protein [Chitinimonas sp. BJB300]|uniref:hypothetical protein n=1 Tax=Chitinimonas sp. BJB300 TaxID=1559339 RepID=UPI000C0EB781|nr:hypothetical protein [Chitinimonas sp. BJB300]PHV12915.1 hypothetical protein CSQ89_03250 [Chitinimonas sp. BJB300]TSJ88484.1 hypothetical protein FG002_009915 [Chitinimonas sp. BJB300]